jgi:tRNA threonylcarbamoyladenosine biosynthesis protein TsaB
MSIILAIETSSELASVALSLNGETMQRQFHGAQTHSQTVLPMVREMLARAGIDLARCDAIAFGSGPGSFTGVRTACGLAQGLAFGANLPVIPIVTLEALAHGCRKSFGADDIVPVIDARMGEVYWAQYRWQDGWQMVFEPALASPGMIRCEGTPLACGNGIAAYREQFDQFLLDKKYAGNILLPHASQLLELAEVKLRQGQVVKAQDAQPFYLRNKVAFTSAERAARLTA